jgi:sulfur-oxidizing protein SoxX
MKASAALIGLLLPLAAHADEAVRQRAEQVVRESFATATPQEWAARMQQDDVQALCSQYRNQPPPPVAEQIATSQRRAIRYPSDGKLMRDWKNGEALARIGSGGHIGKIQPDPPGARRGGNCYACHRLDAGEVAAGTIGPSLTGYGKQRGTARESIQYVYEKIYNAQAYFPCSLMPRFGHNGWLTPEEIADIVAFLLDPASPVNK